MSPDEYWRRIARIPLYKEVESPDGRSVRCRAQDNTPVLVTKPEFLAEEDRDFVIQEYERWYSPRFN